DPHLAPSHRNRIFGRSFWPVVTNSFAGRRNVFQTHLRSEEIVRRAHRTSLSWRPLDRNLACNLTARIGKGYSSNPKPFAQNFFPDLEVLMKRFTPTFFVVPVLLCIITPSFTSADNSGP